MVNRTSAPNAVGYSQRKVNSVETWQVYGIDGELLGEYAAAAVTFVPTKEYGYRNGELLVTVTSGDDQRVKRFLQALYYGALQVDAPSQWMTDKTNELAVAGAQSQAQLLVKAKEIARALFVQTTYETNPLKSDTQYVTDLYYAYLQRGPDASGLGWWVGQAAGSVQNRINVCNAFEASGEFLTLVNTLYGTATSDGQRTENYVTNFYQGALARPPDSNELATNGATLNNAAGQGQSQVISAAETMGRNLFAPQVNDASLSNTQFVTNLYEGFLQRGPDASGLGWWSGQASVGSGRQNVLNAFAASSAFRELAGTLYREANWLVTDQLGTPRMVVNKSGSLASVKRHDYLPFGEEILAATGGRTTGQGYSGDSVRQKFTSKERDHETGLDYFQHRYYSSAQGRFTSVDPENYQAMLDPNEAQSWNAYTYVNNNPLIRVDVDGRGVLRKLWNKIRWDVYGEDEDVRRVEQEKRQFIYDNLFQKDAQGNWHHVDISNLNRDQVWILYDEVERGTQNSDSYHLTPEELISALPPGVAPSAGTARSNSEPWRSTNAARPLNKMGHAAKHLKEFQAIDPNLTADDVAKILEHVRRVAKPTATSFGGKAFQAAVDIGGKSVTVKVIESAGGVIKTGYPVP